MAKIKKNIQEKGLDCTVLSRLYSTVDKEDREHKKKVNKIFAFTKKCEREASKILAEIKKQQKLEEKMEGLYLEVFEFVEDEMPKIYRAMNGEEILSYGTDFGKNYHNLIEKRNEIISQMNGTIKLNGIKITQEVPEINIIKVGEV